jgi:hypothetical protein
VYIVANEYDVDLSHNLSSLIKLVTSSRILEATLLLMVDIVGTLACIIDSNHSEYAKGYEKGYRYITLQAEKQKLTGRNEALLQRRKLI